MIVFWKVVLYNVILLIISIFLSNCESDNKIQRIDFDGVEIKYSLIEIIDTNYIPNFQFVKSYITPQFTIIERPVFVPDSRDGFPPIKYHILDLKFTNSKKKFSLIKYDHSFLSLFETNDFYYFPYDIKSALHFNEIKDSIYKFGLLVIYKEPIRYTIISFTNEYLESVNQKDNMLIIKTNKMYLKSDCLGVVFHEVSRATKYYLERSGQLKEYIFVK